MAVGYSGDIRRVPSRDHHAAYNGCTVEFSSGGRTVHRLSQRGNRQLTHALHMAAICQIRHPHSEGRSYFDRKIAEGKDKKEAIRALKRQVFKAVYRRLLIDANK
jgi:transposase